MRQLQFVAAEALALKDILAASVGELQNWTYDDLSAHQDTAPILHSYERSLDRCFKRFKPAGVD